MRRFPKNKNGYDLHGKKKLQYIWDYYKLPLTVICVVLYTAIYISYRHFTDKDPVLYAALVNVDAGETLTEQLSDDFLPAAGMDTSRNTVCLYSNLYLTDDRASDYYEYAYTSQIKILAAIDGERLDVVLMDREAFDSFARDGYLCDMERLLSEKAPAFYEDAKPFIAENTPMALELTQAGLLKQARFDAPVYVGIVANSPRADVALEYLKYLFYGR